MSSSPHPPVPAPAATTAPQRRTIRRRLLGWYDDQRRDLPWRQRQDDAYAQWVAEIMLQQTRTDTVGRYYERFLERFPNVGALARARESSVLKAWEGLGYYRRARNLHRAAKLIYSNGRAIPTTAKTLVALPGIGSYTAAAIASIAFGEAVAAVDGNVARVIARLFAIDRDVRSGCGAARVARIAGELISRTRPGDFNQAWMDLGSMICTPEAPKCPICPISRSCKACANGTADRLPNRGGNSPPRPVDLLTVICLCRGRMLVVRHRDGGSGSGWWSGLWGFPFAERKSGQPLRAALETLSRAYGLSLESTPKRVSTVRHPVTHRTLNFDVRVAAVNGEPSNTRDAPDETVRRWVTPRQFDALPVSTAHRRIRAAAASALP